MIGTFGHVFKNDGFLGLYSGLSASLLRQITYSTTRFGIYEELKSDFTTQAHAPSFPTLIAMASMSGFLGGIAGNPADVLNVRMQHDAALPKDERRNYKNAIDGLIRMTREEGWKSLFRGVWPNSMRAVLMTASQLASCENSLSGPFLDLSCTLACAVPLLNQTLETCPTAVVSRSLHTDYEIFCR